VLVFISAAVFQIDSYSPRAAGNLSTLPHRGTT
jgi:hypothetical protein